LFTRRGNDWTGHFPGISAKVLEMPIESGILDGELVVLNKDGISSFQALQNKMKSGAEAPLLYYVFDIPHFGGYDLTRVPLLDRKRLLRSIVADDEKGSIRYSDHIEGRGKEVFANACRLHLEGVVSKLKNSRYESRRSKSWLKVKCQRGQEFVIGGWTEPSGAREHFGALLLGYYKEAGGLVYCGKVGTGFTGTSLAEIYAHLKKLERRSASFINPPRGSEARGVHWLEPKLVAEVAFTEWTTDGNVRHPSFQGLREDKDAREVVREMAEDERGSNGAAARRGSGTADTGPRAETTMPASSKRRASGRAASSNGSGGMVSKDRAAHPGETRKKAGAALRPSGAPSRPSTDSADSTMIAGVRLSNPDRVLYPEVGLTKLDVARYYESVAEFVLPHVIHRPLSLVRCPRGWDQKCFFQKHLPEDLPPGVRGIPIKEKTSTDTYIVIDDLSGLISLVQMGVLEIHPWGSREDRIEQPDRLTFDFDPGTDVGWRGVVRGAQLCRDLLSKAGLRSWVKTSGGKGLHVVVPLMRSTGWEDAKDFAHAVADEMVRREPTLYTANMSKAKRSGKIFVDYLRNGRGATSVAAYSTRARSGAPVSTPLGWDELEGDIGATSFSIGNVPQRLKRLKKDPWDATGFGGVKQSITGSALRALRR
jgi:bifunctional non-homologous end joining protein LigD